MFKEILERVIQKENLSQEEAALLMEEIMTGKLTSVQVAALLVAFRMKGETVDELTGFATVMRQKVRPMDSHHSWVVDTCGTGGDGGKTFNISTTAAFVAAGVGVPIAKHGNAAISSQCGSADLLKGLGVRIDADFSRMKEALEKIGICFLFAPLFHPSMIQVSLPRKEIGVRSVFNLLGPLTNPVGAKAQVLGVFKKEWVRPLAQVLMKLGSLEAFVVHGEDGLDEVTTTGPTWISHLKDGQMDSYFFNPESLGFQRSNSADLRGGDLDKNIGITRNILDGKKGPQRDIVILNAAFAVLAGRRALSLEEALQKSQEAIDSGKAMEKLNQLIELTH
ncbi:MAG: anthranilate phosphoribosyltransferase [Chlamydiae bacterium]|nr:anthranilate phosphoribosyltransferase [Chlamydiota bacterium]MBI3277072.1 anthranilate phosphoribosyltransferase [Chlamydiota bacterium]